MCVYVYISTRQGSFLSVGRDFLMWKTSFKDFVKTALRLHWMEPARKNKSVGTLFDTQNMPSPHTFTPSSKTSNPTTPRLVNKRRLTSSSPSASASSSHHNEDGVDLVELWTNSLESCGAIVCVCVCVFIQMGWLGVNIPESSLRGASIGTLSTPITLPLVGL